MAIQLVSPQDPPVRRFTAGGSNWAPGLLYVEFNAKGQCRYVWDPSMPAVATWGRQWGSPLHRLFEAEEHVRKRNWVEVPIGGCWWNGERLW